MRFDFAVNQTVLEDRTKPESDVLFRSSLIKNIRLCTPCVSKCHREEVAVCPWPPESAFLPAGWLLWELKLFHVWYLTIQRMGHICPGDVLEKYLSPPCMADRYTFCIAVTETNGIPAYKTLTYLKIYSESFYHKIQPTIHEASHQSCKILIGFMLKGGCIGSEKHGCLIPVTSAALVYRLLLVLQFSPIPICNTREDQVWSCF